MNSKFWQQRWQEGRIGFHQSDVNLQLIKYFSTLALPIGSRVLVPLCGKSVDMVWLARAGYDVIGIELVESAVQAFFDEQNITPIITEFTSNFDESTLKRYQGQLAGQTISLWVADIFALSSTAIGDIAAVYDRAALIALPADVRPDYSEQIYKLSNNAPQLLITLNYEQSKKDGPPFSISQEQLKHYYDANYEIIELENQSSILNSASELSVTEHVWLLSKR
ncbi:thiopurine S-methyltransferase [Psychrobacter luti]|uniref:Thiopurine S-methyltransferase n=1 Tax=Psychrobacter luti TaxID=198481 RepID=A0A839TEG6_9GAMM|nr:thiopurine S-methyltransferase [Psychrobacter luti]MBB3107831.1 thiopurine S-methyltransferase [Psychrobacter luti]